MKRIFKIFIISVLLILPNSVFGASVKPSQSSIYRYSDYVIDSYDIKIVVNENNTFDITESITAYFNTSKHGIYRKIPLKNTVNRLDGSTTTNRARITDLKVNNEYTTSKSLNSSFSLISLARLSPTVDRGFFLFVSSAFSFISELFIILFRLIYFIAKSH